MKKQLGSNLVRLIPQRVAVFGALILATLFAFSGCATNQDSNPAPASAAQKPHSENIILQEGDMVQISFPGSPDLDTAQQIRRDGKITLQLVGEVQASGLTPEQLQASLIKLYAPQIESKQITVSLQSSLFPVFVTGAVVRPGKVMSDHPITALEAIMEAGGFDYATANLKAVNIIRTENGVSKRYVVNLKRVLDGDEGKPFYLKPQDIIYVSERFEMF